MSDESEDEKDMVVLEGGPAMGDEVPMGTPFVMVLRDGTREILWIGGKLLTAAEVREVLASVYVAKRKGYKAVVIGGLAGKSEEQALTHMSSVVDPEAIATFAPLFDVEVPQRAVVTFPDTDVLEDEGDEDDDEDDDDYDDEDEDLEDEENIDEEAQPAVPAEASPAPASRKPKKPAFRPPVTPASPAQRRG